jgi:hypothetical protein
VPHMQDLVAQHAATVMSRIAAAPNNSLERTGDPLAGQQAQAVRSCYEDKDNNR